MKITFDPAKRAETLRKRRIDFLDAEHLFAGPKFTFPDERLAYPELR
ncbi:MAG TPA: BrnT family toxin [Patescibacteria group bacterium]|nr:BrnT family toxin [Patescibacteria group bacterium]